MVPWSHLRQPLLRVTVDEADIGIDTLNYIIIRLSKVKQLAFRLCSILRSPVGPVVPGNLVKGFSTAGSRAEQSETSFFAAAPAFTQHHDMNHDRQQACPFPAGVVSLVFGEVEHIVHLIRWNLNSCLCHCGTT